jgi:hypothetical protein
MARSTQTRDFRREEDRVIRKIDRTRSRGGNVPTGFLQRQRSDVWRVPLVEIVPGLPAMFAQVTGVTAG